MPLDPVLEQYLAQMPPPPLEPFDIVLMRQQSEARMPMVVGPAGLDEVAGVEERNIDGPTGPMPIRIYRPIEQAKGVMHFIHGGGWHAGSLVTIDHTARRICHTLNMVVVTSTYRLAPEHPFPAAFEDSLTAAEWVLRHATALTHGPIVIGGDSAGGNQVAAICLALRARTASAGGRSFDGQLLLYPAVDLRASAASYPSRLREAHPGFSSKGLDSLIEAYRGSHDPADPRMSPLAAPDLSRLPAALVVALSIDPLRDEAVAYVERLKATGVHAELVEFDHLTHGFVDLAGVVPAAARATAVVLERFRAMIGL